MKLTLNWLRDFVDLPGADPEEIRDVFESLGHEVEEMKALEASFSGVVVGRVLEVGPHPNADQVRLCRVDTGSEELDIVCGAWNFEAGAVVPVAVPGATLQGTYEIGRRKIRGVVSNGMICSEAELELGEDAAGIMVLTADYPEAADHIGDDFAEVLSLPDVYYEISITANRPDCMSVLGLARELAAYYEAPLHVPAVSVVEQEPGSTVSVTIDDAEACPRFAAREMSDVKVGPSPHWLRWRLALAGVRPISNVVDASNYAMIEMGHPTHAFDLDRLADTVVVRRAAPDETVVTLDEVERDLLTSDIVVADAEKPVAIAGVMGGADTEVHEGTTRILIEAAYWQPPSIMLTSKRLGLRSEASARFERGMDPEFCLLAADRVAQLLEQIAGARAVSNPIDVYPGRTEPRRIELGLNEVERHLGIPLPGAAVTSLLTRLGFEVSGGDPLAVDVPTRRPDVARSIDLIEEVARLHGFDKFPGRVAKGIGGGLPVTEINLRRLRAVMVGAGLYEAMNFSFIGTADLDALELRADDPRREAIPVTNPLRDEEGVMRTTLLPGLLKAAGVNVARKLPGASLFETGKVFIPGGGKIPEQPEHLGFVMAGSHGGDWEVGGREADVRDATGLWNLIAHELRLPDPGLRPAAPPGFHPGRSAEALVAGTVVGIVGEVHPRVAAAFGLSGRVVAGEIEIEDLLIERDDWTFLPPSLYPPAIFDLAFEVDEGVAAADILAAIDTAGGDVLESRRIFDVFVGAPIPEGRKSIAVRLTLRDEARTLTDEEDVAPIRREIVTRVEEATGAALRGEA
jgi:phenylalanyl-tRNA synthetase beta chain